MSPRLAALLLAAVLTASCQDPPNPTASVTLKGRKIDVTVFATERERRTATLACTTLPDGRGYLLLWPRERFLKLEPLADAYDAVFLDRGGKVVDTGRLDRGGEGLVPQAEASAALLLPTGDLARLAVQKGDAAALAGTPAAEELPLMKVGDLPVWVELAITGPERNHGLMFRPRMSADDGMLFAYPDEHQRTFWMRNTLIPLDIAYFAADGTLLNVNETPTAADPRRDSNPPTAPSAGAARYVLEMNLGWFKRKGLVDADGKVKLGTKATFPPQAVNESKPD